MRLATLVRLITHSDCADGAHPTLALSQYRLSRFPPTNMVVFRNTRPTLQTWLLRPRFPSPICPWFAMGDGNASRYARLSIYFSTNYVACKYGKHLGQAQFIRTPLHRPMPRAKTLVTALSKCVALLHKLNSQSNDKYACI
jgi:hypothetical protein